MELPLITKVLTGINVAASGPEILMAIIIFINASKFKVLDKMKGKPTSTKVSGFSGGNFEL